MKLFFYYAWHSFVNQVKKMLKPWMIILLLFCIAVGVIFGVIGSMAEDVEEPETGEVPPEESREEQIFEQMGTNAVIECIAGAAILVTLMFALSTAGKSGGSIFLPADATLLFAAPIKPQSVLLFRTTNQIMAILVILAFQIPNLILNSGLPLLPLVGIGAGLVGLIVFSRLLTIFVYTTSATYEKIKKYTDKLLYVFLIAIAVLFFGCFLREGRDVIRAVTAFFTTEWTRWIPIYGWLLGTVSFALEGNVLPMLVEIALLAVSAVLSAIGIWSIRADFYEDASARADKAAHALDSAQNGGVVAREKSRKAKYSESALRHGSGANVFFFTAMYNRFRFAHLHLFTKTSELYLLAAALVGCVQRFGNGSTSFTVIGLILTGLSFFRSFGDPLGQDIAKPYFTTVPASSYEKVLFSLLGGTVCCALDLLPAVAVAAVLIGANPLEALFFLFFALAVDFYASNTMLFLDVALPTSIAAQIKQVIMVIFVEFGILPIALVLILGNIFGFFLASLVIAAVLAVLIGTVFFSISPAILNRGRK